MPLSPDGKWHGDFTCDRSFFSHINVGKCDHVEGVCFRACHVVLGQAMLDYDSGLSPDLLPDCRNLHFFKLSNDFTLMTRYLLNTNSRGKIMKKLTNAGFVWTGVRGGMLEMWEPFRSARCCFPAPRIVDSAPLWPIRDFHTARKDDPLLIPLVGNLDC